MKLTRLQKRLRMRYTQTCKLKILGDGFRCFLSDGENDMPVAYATTTKEKSESFRDTLAIQLSNILKKETK